jgi:hypothetical protein
MRTLRTQRERERREVTMEPPRARRTPKIAEEAD